MTTSATPAKPVSLDDYAPIVGAAEIEEMRALARQLAGRTVKMVNSTSVGGGVAEILNRLVRSEILRAIEWSNEKKLEREAQKGSAVAPSREKGGPHGQENAAKQHPARLTTR